jgi:hypothetical protein
MLKENEEIESKYYNMGKDDGFDWAKKARHTELRYAVEIFNPYESGYETKVIYGDGVLGSYFFKVLGRDPVLKPGDGEEYLPVAGERWLNGWLESVRFFWLEVSSKL